MALIGCIVASLSTLQRINIVFTRVTLSDFRDAFRTAGRKDQFSYDGLRVIFDYLEEYEESTGEPVEFDVIAICCDYTEMTPEEIIEANSIPYNAAEDDLWDTVRDFLDDRTSIVGETDETIVFAQF